MVTLLRRVLTVALLALPVLVYADKKVDETVAKALGQLEKNRENTTDPITAADKLAKEATSVDSQLGAARIYAHAGKLDEGLAAARKASELSASATPEVRAQILNQLAALELRVGTSKDALAHAQEAAKLSQAPEILATLVRAQVKVSDPNAQKTAEDLVAAAPTNAAAHDAHGRALAQAGKLDEALAEYAKAQELDPKDPLPLAHQAMALADAGRGVDAEAAARRAIALDPNQPEGFATLAAALLVKDPKSPTAAATQVAQAIFLAPNSAYVQYTAARCYEAGGNLGPAAEAYKKASLADPGFTKARVGLIQMRYWRGEVDAAAAEAAKLVEDQPNDTDAQLLYGRILVRKNDYVGALEPLERAVPHLPKNADAHALLGTVYQYNHQTQDAVAEYKQAVELAPANLDYQSTYGLLLGVSHQTAQGIAILEKVVHTPGYKDAAGFINLGWLYRNAEPPRALDSVAAYKKALELDPKSAAAALGLGWAQYTAKNWADAIAAFAQSAQLEPKLAGEANLASAWCQYWATVDAKSKDMTKARQAFDKAKQSLPANDPRPGKLLASIDRFEKAGQAEERSVKVEKTPEEKPDLATVVAQANAANGPAKVAAIRAMGSFGADAVQYLVDYLIRDPSLRVRTAAARSLGTVGAPAQKAVTYLQQKMNESREFIMLPPAGVKVTAEDVVAHRELQEACQEAIRRITGK